MKTQSGFTLIELVMILVVLGVLAAIAVPEYFDMKNDALKTAANETAGVVSAACTANFAKRMISPTPTTGWMPVANCASLTGTTNNLIIANIATFNNAWTLATVGTAPTANGAVLNCTIVDKVASGSPILTPIPFTCIITN